MDKHFKMAVIVLLSLLVFFEAAEFYSNTSYASEKTLAKENYERCLRNKKLHPSMKLECSKP